jgi:glycosyltransferase involved in cell wall biosynthesis
MANLIFIGHEASLSGAPYTQLYLLQWLRANTDHRVDLVLLRGGALLSEFAKVATVHVVHRYAPNPPLGQKLLRKADALTGLTWRTILGRLARRKAALIFANTALTLEIAVEIKEKIRAPLLLHLHELTSIFFHIDTVKFAELTKKVDYFVFCSLRVEAFYQGFCTVRADCSAIVYDFAGARPGDVSTADTVRAELGLAVQAPVVGVVGSLGWRKGSDLFLQVAAHHYRRYPGSPAQFVWAGGETLSQGYRELALDVQLMGLADRVSLVGSRKDVRGFYELFDVFLLPSREDPFPLVCMEAAAQGCPLVCFEPGPWPKKQPTCWKTLPSAGKWAA